MLRRMFWLAGAVALALAILGFAAGQAGAQEADPAEPPPCPPGETCVDPPAPCDPDVLCADPIDCPVNEPCTEPCPPEKCELPDADSDGFFDFDEEYWGSDPNDANSTPEHGYLPESCTDAVDNDGDGAVDMGDPGCNVDSDEDGVADPTDNCPWDSNPGQADRDGDGTGDACDYDADNDTWDDETERMAGSDPNNAASTPEHTNIGSCDDGIDNDGDGMTDAGDPGCAPDQDYDFVPDASDNCPTMWNQDQADGDGDGTGDACEDSDGDGFYDLDEGYMGSDPNDANSTPEVPWIEQVCSDGRDNDGDGQIDNDDEGCREIFEALPVADGGGRDDNGGVHIARDTTKAQPAALPSAGSGPAGDGSSQVAVALMAGAALATTVVVAAGARLARRRAR